MAEEYYSAADLADSAALYRRLHGENGNGQDQPASESWPLLSIDEFHELPEPDELELLGPLVLRGGRTIIGGDSGHGKTTLTYHMLAAIVTGQELLGYTGANLGPALIVDLEQGVRSIKRGTLEAGLVGTHTHVVSLPDGLALDRNQGDMLRLEEVISLLEPSVMSLDPYYKAHRGDANEERAVTDLMRHLDRLRAEYGFALLLPAHVRKDQQGTGARKLTLADIAGSGAISRGAEIVLGLERLSHGQARLRYLKDREGDLPVGDAIDLTYSHDDGWAVKVGPSSESIEGKILERIDSDWMTVKEWSHLIECREGETKRVLERLAAAEQISFAIGPQGRSGRARCFSTRIEQQLLPNHGSTPEQSGAVGTDSATAPLRPTTSVGGGRWEQSTASQQLLPDDDDIPL